MSWRRWFGHGGVVGLSLWLWLWGIQGQAQAADRSAEGIFAQVQVRRLDSLVSLLKQLSQRRILRGVPIRRIERSIGYLDGNVARMLGVQWQRGFTMTIVLAKQPFSAPIDAVQLPEGALFEPLKRLRLAISLPVQTSFFTRFTLRRAFAASRENLRFFEENYGGTVSFWLLGRQGPAWVLVLHGGGLVLCPLPHRSAVFAPQTRRLLWSSVMRPLLDQVSSGTALQGRLWLEDRVQANAQIAFFLHPPTLAAWMKEPLWGIFQKRPTWEILRLQLQRYRALLAALFLGIDRVQFQEIVLPDEATLQAQKAQSPSSTQDLSQLGMLFPQDALFVSLQGQARPPTTLAALLAQFSSEMLKSSHKKTPEPSNRSSSSSSPLEDDPIWWPLLQRVSLEKALYSSLHKALGKVLLRRGLLVGGGWLWQQDTTSYLLRWLTKGRRILWLEPPPKVDAPEKQPDPSASQGLAPHGILLAGRWDAWQRELWKDILHELKDIVEAPLGSGLPMQDAWPLRLWWPDKQPPLALAWDAGRWFLSNSPRLLGTWIAQEQRATTSPQRNAFPSDSLFQEEVWRNAHVSHARIAFLLSCFLSKKQLAQFPMLAYAKAFEIGSRRTDDGQELRYHLLLDKNARPYNETAALLPQKSTLCLHTLPVWRLIWLDALAPLQRSFAWQILRPLAPSLRRAIFRLVEQL